MDYTSRLNILRGDILMDMATTIANICQHTGETNVLWDNVTGHSNPDITCEQEFGPSSVLPDTLSVNADHTVHITFASYCQCPDSLNGENLHTDTLLEVLENLKSYQLTL